MPACRVENEKNMERHILTYIDTLLWTQIILWKVWYIHFKIRKICSKCYVNYPDLQSYSSFPGDSVVKNPPANAGDAGDAGLVSGSGRSPGGANGNLLCYSCRENSMDRGDWQAQVHGVAKNCIQVSTHTHTHTHRDSKWWNKFWFQKSNHFFLFNGVVVKCILQLKMSLCVCACVYNVIFAYH